MIAMSTATLPARTTDTGRVDETGTAADLCQYFHVGPGTIRLWVKAGKLPAPQRGGMRPLWPAHEIRSLGIAEPKPS
jgi:hypothetical protein